MFGFRLLGAFLLLFFISVAHAQFQFFEHMFGGAGGGGGGGGGGGRGGQRGQQGGQNVPSDSSWYQGQWDSAHCDKYLCPGTLACVHFPHHCPCPHPGVEEKVELGEGSAVCVSRGGFKEGEAARKIELARKGVL